MRIITLMIMAILLSFGTIAMASQQANLEQGQHKQCAHKGGMHGKMGHKGASHHANPMPNLMMMVKKKGDELNLTPDQQKALAAWRDKNHGVYQEQVAQVITLEREIMSASLEGADKAALMSKVDEMLAVRRSIAEGKVNCRDNLKIILNEEQYNIVVSAYQAHLAAKVEKMMQY